MSYLEILGINAETGQVESYGEARNSWGGGMFIWNTLSVKYLGREMSRQTTADDPLWQLWKDRRLHEHERIALLWSFDTVYVDRANCAKLADALKQFYAENKTQRDFHGGSYTVDDTLVRGAAIIRKAVDDESIRGLCFSMTSVNCDAWQVRLGEYDPSDPGGNESRLFRFGVDDAAIWGKPYELFAALTKGSLT